MLKLLILGGRGLLGSELLQLAASRGIEVSGMSRAECDITSAPQVEAALASRPSAVVNCAAYNSVDRAESEPDLARRVNAAGPGNVAAAAVAVSAAVVHFSTDFVFDGKKQSPYLETDLPNPQSTYARSKALGDQAVAAANLRHFVLRVGCLYGAAGKGFGSTLLARLRRGERVRADGERRVQPTWGGAVAAQTLAVLGSESFGLFHAMCHGETSWAEFSIELARQAGCNARLVDAVATASLGAPAQRPRYAVLENRALAGIGLDRMPSWEAALTAYLEKTLNGGSP